MEDLLGVVGCYCENMDEMRRKWVDESGFTKVVERGAGGKQAEG